MAVFTVFLRPLQSLWVLQELINEVIKILITIKFKYVLIFILCLIYNVKNYFISYKQTHNDNINLFYYKYSFITFSSI